MSTSKVMVLGILLGISTLTNPALTSPAAAEKAEKAQPWKDGERSDPQKGQCVVS